MYLFAAVLVGLVPMIPAVIYFFRERKAEPTRATRGLLMGLTGFNVIIGLMAAGLGLVWLASPSTVMAAGLAAEAAAADPYATLAAAISTGLASIGAGHRGELHRRGRRRRHRRETRILWPRADLRRYGRRYCDLRSDHLLHGAEPVGKR